MFYKEAVWVYEQVRPILAAKPTAILVNLGSQTEDFRRRDQPHISKFLFDPVRNAFPHVQVIHVDASSGPGVDLQLDLTAESSASTLVSLQPSVVLISNLMEHVEDLEALRSLILDLMDCGAIVVISGPLRYPYHPDPIDNMFRPRRRDLVNMFPGRALLTYRTFWSASALTAACTTRRERSNAWRWFIQSLMHPDPQHGRPSFSLTFPVTAFGAVFRA